MKISTNNDMPVMNRFLYLLACIASFIYAFTDIQAQDTGSIYSSQNILKFADHLFLTNDFLRAAEEYQKLPTLENRDTILFKSASCYEMMLNYSESEKYLELIDKKSQMAQSAALKMLKLKLLTYDFYKMDSLRNKNVLLYQSDEAGMLDNTGLLLSELKLPEENIFLRPFSKEYIAAAKLLYKRKSDPPYKSMTAAAILSAVIPGAGKIYAGRVADGITSAVSNGLLAYAAYDNFRADHKFRAWVFTALSTWFYAGNIYGSMAAVKINNAEVDVRLRLDINSFLKSSNFFLPDDNTLFR